jgi:hypothetical protein
MDSWKNRPKGSPVHILSKWIQIFYRGKKVTKNMGCLGDLQKRRKFEQSGHAVQGQPGANPTTSKFTITIAL